MACILSECKLARSLVAFSFACLGEVAYLFACVYEGLSPALLSAFHLKMWYLVSGWAEIPAARQVGGTSIEPTRGSNHQSAI